MQQGDPLDPNVQYDIYAGVLAEWAPQLVRQASLEQQIITLMERLASKRVTFEEKMIRRYLHALCAQFSMISHKVQLQLSQEPQKLKSDALAPLRILCDELSTDLGELAKVVAYDLNFVEQYYEHGFYSKLAEEKQYQERLEKIVCAI